MSTPILHPDPVRSKREPFAAIPHTACVSDLSDAAYRVLGAVTFFARRGSCDATDRQLGQRCGKSVPAIQRSLRELEAKGWIERLSGARRVIRLRAPADPTPSGPIPDLITPDQGPDHRRSGALITPDQGPDHRRSPLKNGDGEEGRNVTSLPPPEEAAASPGTAPGPRPEPPPAPRPSGPVRPLLDELKALPGADDPKVRSLAWRLAHFLGDVASVAFFTLVLGLIARGAAPLQRLLDAFRVADQSRGKARKPGAIFASTWSGWQPPPLPSSINRPAYHRAPRPGEPPPPPLPGSGPEATMPLIAPPPSAEDIRSLRIRTWTAWAADPRDPNHKIGVRNLARLEAEAPPGPATPRDVGAPPPGP